MDYSQMLLVNFIMSLWDLPRYKTFITKKEVFDMFDNTVNELSEFRAFSDRLKMEIDDYVLTWHQDNMRISDLEHDLMGFYQRRKK